MMRIFGGFSSSLFRFNKIIQFQGVMLCLLKESFFSLFFQIFCFKGN